MREPTDQGTRTTLHATQDYDRDETMRAPSSSRRYVQPYKRPAPPIVAELRPGSTFIGGDGIEYVVMAGSRPIKARSSAGQITAETHERQPTTRAAPPTKKQSLIKRLPWQIVLALGMVAAIILVVLIADLLTWWHGVQDDWTYTHDFRTFSVDKAVGHNGDSPDHPSHFIVQNDKGQIVIIEFPRDDIHQAHVYPGPTLFNGADARTPVTIRFQVTTDSGRLDLILQFQDQQVMYLNNGTQFVTPQ